MCCLGLTVFDCVFDSTYIAYEPETGGHNICFVTPKKAARAFQEVTGHLSELQPLRHNLFCSVNRRGKEACVKASATASVTCLVADRPKEISCHSRSRNSAQLHPRFQSGSASSEWGKSIPSESALGLGLCLCSLTSVWPKLWA